LRQHQVKHASEDQDHTHYVQIQPMRGTCRSANRKTAPAVMRRMPAPVPVTRLPPPGDRSGGMGWPGLVTDVRYCGRCAR
jgi:hypothetical protein